MDVDFMVSSLKVTWLCVVVVTHTYHWVFGVNLQDLGEGRMCLGVIVLTQMNKCSETQKHYVSGLQRKKQNQHPTKLIKGA